MKVKSAKGRVPHLPWLPETYWVSLTLGIIPFPFREKSLSESKMLCSRTQHDDPGLGHILKSSGHKQGLKSYFEIEI